MAQLVLMPKQGNSVESCIMLEWKKNEGEPVATGDILCEAETDKAAIEVESTAEGVLLKQLFQAEEEVPVQVPIAIIGEPGESISGILQELGKSDGTPAASEQPASPDGEAADEKTEASAAVGVRSDASSEGGEAPAESGEETETHGISPRARKTAARLGVAVGSLTATGPKGRIIERDILSAAAAHQPLTPSATSLKAADESITVPVRGSGIGGRILAKDIVPAADSPAVDKQPAVYADVVGIMPVLPGFPGSVQEVPVRSIRKITARRMFESISTTCQLTLDATADAVQLKALRERFKKSDPQLGLTGITINDLLLFAVSRTVSRFRYVNSHFLGERIIEFDSVHLGQAVDTPRGLMVPVIRFADRLALRDLAAESRRLVEACRNGKAAPEDLEGGTFTITNLGALGIEHFTPVLNTPQTAILGVNEIYLKPTESIDGKVEFRPHIGFSLTFDHQAYDGAPAARFLKALSEAVRDIDLLLMG